MSLAIMLTTADGIDIAGDGIINTAAALSLIIAKCMTAKNPPQVTVHLCTGHGDFTHPAAQAPRPKVRALLTPPQRATMVAENDCTHTDLSVGAHQTDGIGGEGCKAALLRGIPHTHVTVPGEGRDPARALSRGAQLDDCAPVSCVTMTGLFSRPQTSHQRL